LATSLPDAGAGLAITNLTASGGGRTQGDGTFINSAILNWDDVSNAFSAYYEVEWKALADSTYSSTTTVESSIEISPLVDGVEYIFRVRAVTAAGSTGAYSTVQFTGGGDVTAPGLPTAITADGGFRYITVRWTNPADADLNFVEVWENTSNSSSGATKVGISGGSEFVRSDLGIQETRYYFLKSVDYSGNASAFTTGVSATTTFIDDDDFANGVYSLFTDQGLYAIEDVSSLPASGTFTGEKVFNTSGSTFHRFRYCPHWGNCCEYIR
jgi:predicted phage tail protein